MSVRVRELLNAAGMELPLFVAGQSTVGFNIAGTWTGLVSFFGSFDGIAFLPLAVTPFASGAAILTTTANGTWFSQVKNFMVVKAVFTTLTTGTVAVTIGASLDSSWQRAFLTPTQIFQNSTASHATNTLTLAASTNRAWRLRTLVLSISATATWAASPALTIKDGTTLLWAMDPPVAAGVFQVPLPAPDAGAGIVSGGLVNTIGASLVTALADGGASVVTNINAEFVPA